MTWLQTSVCLNKSGYILWLFPFSELFSQLVKICVWVFLSVWLNTSTLVGNSLQFKMTKIQEILCCFILVEAGRNEHINIRAKHLLFFVFFNGPALVGLFDFQHRTDESECSGLCCQQRASFLQGNWLSVCWNIMQLWTELPEINPKFLLIVFPRRYSQKYGIYRIRGED